jgi:outer membrane protein assembly factor BamC
MAEVYVDARQETTIWQPRPSDPQLEAEFLGRLMVKLAPSEAQATASASASATATASAVAAVSSAPESPPRARRVSGAGAALEVDEPFDRAWRRVGLALDRSGFTVEDRDRAGGLYFVRYVDPKNAGKEEPGFFSRMFSGGSKPPSPLERYRIAVKGGSDNKTTVSVLTGSGGTDTGATGQLIVDQLIKELR